MLAENLSLSDREIRFFFYDVIIKSEFIELCQRYPRYYLGQTSIREMSRFVGIVERSVPIERHIEAALVADGYNPERVRSRIWEIRGLLFTHPTRHLLLTERTLTRYLMDTFGTRRSFPYQRVIRAIRDFRLILD